MFVENNMLLTVSLIFSGQTSWFKNLSMVVIYLGFIFGMIFMFLYYKFFHDNILDDEMSAGSQDSVGSSIVKNLSKATMTIAGIKPSSRYKSDDKMGSIHRYNDTLGAGLAQNPHSETSRTLRSHYLSSNHNHASQSALFNCKTITEHKHKLHSSHSRRISEF